MNFKETVSDAKEQIHALAGYSVNEITHICKTFGPRPCGEASEKAAQLYMAENLKGLADSVTREEFEVHPEAFMAFVPVAGACLIGATACNFVNVFKGRKKASLGSAALIGGALAGVVGEFVTYKEFLDPLFKKKVSGNVVAVRKASGETKRRIVLSGHTDSAPEWTYTYRLGSKGVVTVAGAALAGLAYSTATTAVAGFSSNESLKKKMCRGQLAFLPAYASLFKFTDNKRYVNGANDDLSGCHVAISVMKFLHDNDIRFENTDIYVVLAGGEEAGLRGSKAFFKAHPEMKNDGIETVFLGFDTIRDAEYMMIYNRDMSGVVKNDDRVAAVLQKAAAECGEEVPIGAIPLGSTDAAAASQAGIPAAAFVAMDPAPARYYHTRLDTEDILQPATIEKVIEIALTAVTKIDEQGL